MKIRFPLFAFALSALLMGCAYRGTETPLQRGDKIIFGTEERATAFRTASGNDVGPTNRVVEITRPTLVITE
jgi:hypothetical protein